MAHGELAILPPIERYTYMDKDRIKGSAQQAKGVVKEMAGKVTGDAKLERKARQIRSRCAANKL
jgi:hypothetical protein